MYVVHGRDCIVIQPIFLLSLPRSGSTLLQRLLAARTDGAIVTRSEPWVVLPFCQALLKADAVVDYQQDLAIAAIDEFLDGSKNGLSRTTLARRCLELVYAEYATEASRYFLDKTTRYTLIPEQLIDIFPNAYYIILWRNPLACAASQSRTWRDGRFYLSNLKVDYYEGLKGLLHLADCDKIKKIEVHYEKLVSDPISEANRIFSFLDLMPDSRVADTYSEVKLKGTFGDPLQDVKYKKVSQKSLDEWMSFYGTPLRYLWARHYLDWIGERSLERMGYSIRDMKNALSIREWSGFRSDGVPFVKDWLKSSVHGKLLKMTQQLRFR